MKARGRRGGQNQQPRPPSPTCCSSTRGGLQSRARAPPGLRLRRVCQVYAGFSRFGVTNPLPRALYLPGAGEAQEWQVCQRLTVLVVLRPPLRERLLLLSVCSGVFPARQRWTQGTTPARYGDGVAHRTRWAPVYTGCNWSCGDPACPDLRYTPPQALVLQCHITKHPQIRRLQTTKAMLSVGQDFGKGSRCTSHSGFFKRPAVKIPSGAAGVSEGYPGPGGPTFKMVYLQAGKSAVATAWDLRSSCLRFLTSTAAGFPQGEPSKQQGEDTMPLMP
ncbi:uncharacterized protein LOC123794888 [Ursus americanus]|uniref:uncharacterized protein LOC123794888 n=1 Tax=Ursus americanus TaxID=9643 RepID=UPI001E67B02B|nr:uncharacterized protein LOC123794888 [Ursus americanus]